MTKPIEAGIPLREQGAALLVPIAKEITLDDVMHLQWLANLANRIAALLIKSATPTSEKPSTRRRRERALERAEAEMADVLERLRCRALN